MLNSSIGNMVFGSDDINRRYRGRFDESRYEISHIHWDNMLAISSAKSLHDKEKFLHSD